jgi:hypothetical protein
MFYIGQGDVKKDITNDVHMTLRLLHITTTFLEKLLVIGLKILEVSWLGWTSVREWFLEVCTVNLTPETVMAPYVCVNVGTNLQILSIYHLLQTIHISE